MKKTETILRKRYKTVAVRALREKFGYNNQAAIPRISKVVVNVGVGKATTEPKELDAVVKSLERITGQKPVLTRAKKSIASFKLRAGMPIGAVVTLRGKRMENFLEKLVHAALPRVRDFQGLSTESFGSNGTFSIGLKEHLVFPEIASENIESIHGVGISVVTTAETADEGMVLLRALGFPFRT